MIYTKGMFSLEYVLNNLLGIARQTCIWCAKLSTFARTPLWGFNWFLLQLQPWVHQLF